MPACSRCGSELHPEWKFCVMCGARRPADADRRALPISRSGAVVMVAGIATGAAVVGGIAALVVALAS